VGGVAAERDEVDRLKAWIDAAAALDIGKQPVPQKLPVEICPALMPIGQAQPGNAAHGQNCALLARV
jgi:hypothetical protein